MWPEWMKSPSRAQNSAPPQQPPQSIYFSCPSFKDIHTLLLEEPQTRSISEPGFPRKPSIFHRLRISTSLHRHSKQSTILSPPNNDNHHIIVYFTSLRIVRKTFEDCRTVRSILRGFMVPIDERDLSIDARYLDEVQAITGSKKASLPLVFIGGKYIGGAEEIKEMNENGNLKKLISVLPFVENDGCDICGGLGFVICEQCSGSRKIYSEKYGFRSCTTCNVNGLIRCPLCSRVYRRRKSS